MNDVEVIEAWECCECGCMKNRSEYNEELCNQCDCEHFESECGTCIDCGADRSVIGWEDEYER